MHGNILGTSLWGGGGGGLKQGVGGEHDERKGV